MRVQLGEAGKSARCEWQSNLINFSVKKNFFFQHSASLTCDCLMDEIRLDWNFSSSSILYPSLLIVRWNFRDRPSAACHRFLERLHQFQIRLYYEGTCYQRIPRDETRVESWLLLRVFRLPRFAFTCYLDSRIAGQTLCCRAAGSLHQLHKSTRCNKLEIKTQPCLRNNVL